MQNWKDYKHAYILWRGKQVTWCLKLLTLRSRKQKETSKDTACTFWYGASTGHGPCILGSPACYPLWTWRAGQQTKDRNWVTFPNSQCPYTLKGELKTAAHSSTIDCIYKTAIRDQNLQGTVTFISKINQMHWFIFKYLCIVYIVLPVWLMYITRQEHWL